ncbi:hypothetical protein [Streptomyces sp. enrichment culture]
MAEKSVLPLRAAVREPLRHGRVLLAAARPAESYTGAPLADAG